MPMTWASLRALWDERDNRYATRKIRGQVVPLTVREMSAVLDYRRTEIAMLSSIERPFAVAALSSWSVRYTR